jgi:hypothetical protein
MKIIDHTPFLNEVGEISFFNQIQATLKYGYSWYPEVKAQKVVIDIMSRSLNKGYTLLRNITLPGSQAIIPLILIGPAGVYALFVTHLKGNYQAKGEIWGALEGNKVQTSNSNLLVLTSKMAKSLQRFLDKQGIELSNVDGALIAADPGMHIESVRPIVRVVLSDAIEHFAVTINNSSTIINSLMAQTIIRQLTEPKISPQQAPINVQPPIVGIKVPQTEPNSAPVPEIGELLPWSGDNLGFDYKEDDAQDLEKPFGLGLQPQDDLSPIIEKPPVNSKRLHFDKKQWILLISFGLVEIIILLVFFWMVLINS